MFTASCFIRKNTPELINELIDLGYVKALFDEEYTKSEAYGLIIDQGDIVPLEHGLQEMELMFTYNFVDCDDNEDLFLALAALRDDTDKWQLFVFDGIDVPDYFLQRGDMWICSLDKHLVENCHKATVEEIIEHFKEEQDMENYKIGSKVKHKTRNVIETIVGECKVKIDNKWVEGVIYEGIDYNTGCLMKFVRTKDDFINNFELYEIQ